MRAWASALLGPLGLTRGGLVQAALDGGIWQVRTLVASLRDAGHAVAIATDPRTLVSVPREAVAVLIVHPRDAIWLNLNRPLFAQRRLRVILWCGTELLTELLQQAPDFSDWVSNLVDVPAEVPEPLVWALEAARAHHPWVLLADPEPLTVVVPAHRIARLRLHADYPELVRALGDHRPWYVIEGCAGPEDLVRVRWAAAEAGRWGRLAVRWTADAPHPGWWKVAPRWADPHAVVHLAWSAACGFERGIEGPGPADPLAFSAARDPAASWMKVEADRVIRSDRVGLGPAERAVLADRSWPASSSQARASVTQRLRQREVGISPGALAHWVSSRHSRHAAALEQMANDEFLVEACLRIATRVGSGSLWAELALAAYGFGADPVAEWWQECGLASDGDGEASFYAGLALAQLLLSGGALVRAEQEISRLRARAVDGFEAQICVLEAVLAGACGAEDALLRWEKALVPWNDSTLPARIFALAAEQADVYPELALRLLPSAQALVAHTRLRLRDIQALHHLAMALVGGEGEAAVHALMTDTLAVAPRRARWMLLWPRGLVTADVDAALRDLREAVASLPEARTGHLGALEAGLFADHAAVAMQAGALAEAGHALAEARTREEARRAPDTGLLARIREQEARLRRRRGLDR